MDEFKTLESLTNGSKLKLTQTGEHSEICGGISYDCKAETECKTVGELVTEIDRLNKIAGREMIGWELMTSRARLGVGSFWSNISRDFSIFKDCKIKAVSASGGWNCPCMVEILIDDPRCSSNVDLDKLAKESFL